MDNLDYAAAIIALAFQRIRDLQEERDRRAEELELIADAGVKRIEVLEDWIADLDRSAASQVWDLGQRIEELEVQKAILTYSLMGYGEFHTWQPL